MTVSIQLFSDEFVSHTHSACKQPSFSAFCQKNTLIELACCFSFLSRVNLDPRDEKQSDSVSTRCTAEIHICEGVSLFPARYANPSRNPQCVAVADGSLEGIAKMESSMGTL
jgi:hypothetical protein